MTCRLREIQQSEGRGEHAVHRVAVHVPVREVPAQQLQYRPGDASADRAGNQLTTRNSPGSENAEAEEIHRYVGYGSE